MLFNVLSGAHGLADRRELCRLSREEMAENNRRLRENPFVLKGAMPLLEISGSNLGKTPSELVGVFAGANKNLNGLQIYIAINFHNRTKGARISIIDPITLDTVLTGAIRVGSGDQNQSVITPGFGKVCGAFVRKPAYNKDPNENGEEKRMN